MLLFTNYDEHEAEETDLKKISLDWENADVFHVDNYNKEAEENSESIHNIGVLVLHKLATYAKVRKVIRGPAKGDQEGALTGYLIKEVHDNAKEEYEVKPDELVKIINLNIQVMSEKDTSSIELSCGIDDKIDAIAEDLSKIFKTTKHGLLFMFNKEKLANKDRIVDKKIVEGSRLICMMGSSAVTPKIYNRFICVEGPGG
jgi:hypothetical protein